MRQGNEAMFDQRSIQVLWRGEERMKDEAAYAIGDSKLWKQSSGCE
jgi:hypothetical protein